MCQNLFLKQIRLCSNAGSSQVILRRVSCVPFGRRSLDADWHLLPCQLLLEPPRFPYLLVPWLIAQYGLSSVTESTVNKTCQGMGLRVPGKWRYILAAFPSSLTGSENQTSVRALSCRLNINQSAMALRVQNNSERQWVWIK